MKRMSITPKYSVAIRYTVLSIALIAFLLSACTKEGLQGPQGPQGPPGESGTGSGGARATILSYEIANTFTWEQTASNANYVVTYRLKYTKATNAGYTFTLPDSVTKYIETGGLLLFGDFTDGSTVSNWQQLTNMPSEFYARAAYYYTATKTTAGYQFTILAKNVPHPADEVYRKLRFMIIPTSVSSELEEN